MVQATLAVGIPCCIAPSEHVLDFFCSLDAANALGLFGITLGFMVFDECVLVGGAEVSILGFFNNDLLELALVLP